MSATYINSDRGFIQFTGIITAAEMNTLGTAPYNFITPENFVPICFGIAPKSGTTPQVFTSILTFATLSNRIFFQGTLTTGIDLYSFWGYRLLPVISPTYAEAFNIDFFSGANNFQLVPSNGSDPTPGDYDYKYNLIGFVLI
jgi:hypothetical protein